MLITKRCPVLMLVWRQLVAVHVPVVNCLVAVVDHLTGDSEVVVTVMLISSVIEVVL